MSRPAPASFWPLEPPSVGSARLWFSSRLRQGRDADTRLDVHEPPAAVLRELLAPVVGQARAAVADDVIQLSIELVERHDPCIGSGHVLESPAPADRMQMLILLRCLRDYLDKLL